MLRAGQVDDERIADEAALRAGRTGRERAVRSDFGAADAVEIEPGYAGLEQAALAGNDAAHARHGARKARRRRRRGEQRRGGETGCRNGGRETHDQVAVTVRT